MFAPWQLRPDIQRVRENDPDLEILDWRCSGVNDDTLGELAGALVGNTYVHTADFRNFIRATHTCTYVHTVVEGAITDVGVACITAVVPKSKLEKVIFAQERKKKVPSSAKLIELDHLCIKNLLQRVTSNDPHLVTLKWGQTRAANDIVMVWLADALRSNTHLRELDFSAWELDVAGVALREITDAGASALCMALPYCNVCDVSLPDTVSKPKITEVARLGFQNALELLSNDDSKLDCLQYKCADDASVILLAGALESNFYLRSVFLYGTSKLTDESLRTLARALSKCCVTTCKLSKECLLEDSQDDLFVWYSKIVSGSVKDYWDELFQICSINKSQLEDHKASKPIQISPLTSDAQNILVACYDLAGNMLAKVPCNKADYPKDLIEKVSMSMSVPAKFLRLVLPNAEQLRSGDRSAPLADLFDIFTRKRKLT